MQGIRITEYQERITKTTIYDCGYGKIRKDSVDGTYRVQDRSMKGKKRTKFVGRKLLLMGSKAFRAGRLPAVLAKKLDEAMARKMKIIVGEVPGPCRLFQDYLKRKHYINVTIGHAKSIRYNAGNWKTKQYGTSVTEREKNMIAECDSAVIVWQDSSGVIAENLELLKRSGKPTFLYEYHTRPETKKADWLDPERTYDPYYNWKEFMRKKRPKA